MTGRGYPLPAFWLLDVAGDGQGTDPRLDDDFAGGRILNKSGSRHCNLPWIGGKEPGGGIVGVIDRRGPGGTVKGDNHVGQCRIKGIGDDGIICCYNGDITGVLNHKSIGDLTILRYYSGE